MRTPLSLALLLALVLVVTACAGDDLGDDDVIVDAAPTALEPAETEDGTDARNLGDEPDPSGTNATYEVDVTGAAEVPGPGSEGTGTVVLQLLGEEVCTSGDVDGVETITAGHIHSGTADEAGPVVVDLMVTTDEEGTIDVCAPLDPAQATEIVADPGAFYVNLHNEPFPDGAVRGQLG